MNETAYDTVPYPGHPHPETHPNRLAALARLFGLEAPPVATARVLEIACGDAANLIPIAQSLPRSRCFGFDLAPTAVARAREEIAKLGLTNIDVIEADLVSVAETLGEFDYIIAHGLYSWVPPPVRDSLLTLIRDSLSARGIAFVSHNVYPGWHIGRMVREMLRYHTRGIDDPDTRVVQARALLDFLVVAHPEPDPYGRLLVAECERMGKYTPAHIFHDDLADVNDPVYFHEFVAHASAFDLKFIADADFATMTGADLPEPARLKLDELHGDPVVYGQYLDFVRCRRFRESLLCLVTNSISQAPVAGAVRQMALASNAVADTEPVEFGVDVEVQFRRERRGSLKTNHPLAKAVLVALGKRWPDSMSFDDLLGAAVALLGRPPENVDAAALEQIVVGAFGLRMVELLAERIPRSVPL